MPYRPKSSSAYTFPWSERATQLWHTVHHDEWGDNLRNLKAQWYRVLNNWRQVDNGLRYRTSPNPSEVKMYVLPEYCKLWVKNKICFWNKAWASLIVCTVGDLQSKRDLCIWHKPWYFKLSTISINWSPVLPYRSPTSGFVCRRERLSASWRHLLQWRHLQPATAHPPAVCGRRRQRETWAWSAEPVWQCHEGAPVHTSVWLPVQTWNEEGKELPEHLLEPSPVGAAWWEWP